MSPMLEELEPTDEEQFWYVTLSFLLPARRCLDSRARARRTQDLRSRRDGTLASGLEDPHDLRYDLIGEIHEDPPGSGMKL